MGLIAESLFILVEVCCSSHQESWWWICWPRSCRFIWWQGLLFTVLISMWLLFWYTPGLNLYYMYIVYLVTKPLSVQVRTVFDCCKSRTGFIDFSTICFELIESLNLARKLLYYDSTERTTRYHSWNNIINRL